MTLGLGSTFHCIIGIEGGSEQRAEMAVGVRPMGVDSVRVVP